MRWLISIGFFLFVFNLFSQPIGRLGFAYYDSIPVMKNGESFSNAWAGGLNNPQFSKIDLNYDGDEDLFIFDRSTNQIYTFLYDVNASGSKYKYVPHYRDFFPKMRFWALLRDYNCDGKKDILTYTQGGFKVYTNMGSAANDTLYFTPYNMGNAIETNHNGNNMIISIMATDIAGIADIDGDGDIDILHFPGIGNSIQYNKNMSMENYGHCDSLVFEVKNECWGRFTEDDNTSSVNLYDTLDFPCDGSSVTNPQIGTGNSVERTEGGRHVGSTVTPIDEDGSGVMDLLIGDVDIDFLTLLTNGGTQVNDNSAMVSYDTDFPSYDQSISLNMFPAAYYEDIDNDGVKDLVVAPNMVPNNSDVEDAIDRNAVWYYKNNNTTGNPQFQFQNEAFLQEEMIDIGRGAFPTIFDQDGDGLKDLLIGHFATSYPDITNKTTELHFYKNTGTVNDPVYIFVTKNFASIQSFNLGKELVPAFVDVDGDGDKDMIIGNKIGEVYWMENTAGSGSPMSFNPPQTLNDANGDPITVYEHAYPCVVDLNRDGKQDLVIGQRDGKLTYYSNSATNGSLELNFETATLGGVDVTAPFFVIGHSAPFFLDLEGEYYLFVGSRMGQIFFYKDIDNNLTGNFTLEDSTFNNIEEGFRVSLWMEDVEDNGTLEMFVGSFRGGLMLYQESDSIFLSQEKFNNEWKSNSMVNIFPNPAINELNINFEKSINFEMVEYKLTDISGKIIQKGVLKQKMNKLSLLDFEKGIYILSLFEKNHLIETKRIVIYEP